MTLFSNDRQLRSARRVSGLIFLIFMLIGLGYLVASVGAAPNATIIVDSLNHEVPPFVSNGNCTLGEAIEAANTDSAVDACAAGSGPDTIALPAGTLAASNTFSCELMLGGASVVPSQCLFPIITRSTAFIGAGISQTVIEYVGNASVARHFSIFGGPTVELSQLSLLGGRALDTAGGEGYGAAIFAQGTPTLIVRNALIANHESAAGGGAIRMNNSTGSVLISDSKFENNVTGGNGGAVEAGTVTVANSQFDGNVSGERGGAIFAESLIGVTDSQFSGNLAVTGGAIWSDVPTVTGGTFVGNSAEVGGALFGNTIAIDGTSYISNVASTSMGQGGAVYAGIRANVENALFEGNSAENGGAIKGFGAVTISATTFISNVANGSGASIAQTGPINIDGTEFINNRAHQADIFFSPVHPITMTQSSVEGFNRYPVATFASNGALAIDTTVPIQKAKTALIHDTIFDNNSSGVFLYNMRLDLRRVAITNSGNLNSNDDAKFLLWNLSQTTDPGAPDVIEDMLFKNNQFNLGFGIARQNTTISTLHPVTIKRVAFVDNTFQFYALLLSFNIDAAVDQLTVASNTMLGTYQTAGVTLISSQTLDTQLTLDRSTIVGNVSDRSIRLVPNQVVEISRSLIANNQTVVADVDGAISMGGNLIGKAVNMSAQPDDQFGTVATPLPVAVDEANQTGPNFWEWTAAPMPGSAAIDRIATAAGQDRAAASCPASAVDVRNEPGNVDYDGVNGAACDSGAHERQIDERFTHTLASGERYRFGATLTEIAAVSGRNPLSSTMVARFNTSPLAGTIGQTSLPTFINIVPVNIENDGGALTLCYSDWEVAQNSAVVEASLGIWHFDGGTTWEDLGATTRDVTGNCVTRNGLENLSGFYVLANSTFVPTAVTLDAASALSADSIGERLPNVIALIGMIVTTAYIVLKRKA